MFTFLVSRSLQYRVLVIAASLALMGYGGFAISQLPVDVLPDLNRPTVTIISEAEGYAPQEVEQLITFPIETQMNGLPGVTRVRSVSGVGLSFVYVEFDWSAEIFRSRQQVSERLALVRDQLPPNIAPQLGPVSSIMGQVVMFAVTNPKIPPMELRELADFTIRPRLLTVPGVAQVIPMGGEVRQFRIAVQPSAMRAFNVSHEQIEKALLSFGANLGGGFTDQHSREYLIRSIGRTMSLDDLRNIVVANDANGFVYLRQVAEVDFGARVKRGDAGYMGAPAVLVTVEKQPFVDTLRLTNDLEAALKQLSAAVPEGTRLDQVLFKQSDYIRASVSNVQIVLIEAIVVVAIVLFLFLMNARTTAISLTAIPVSLLITALVFYFAGLSINTMTLGGIAIAIGELVDDAVVDVENIFRRLRENAAAANPRSVFDVVVTASQEVRSGIVYATLVIILVFVPLFALSGIEGRLFVPLGQAYIVAILASLLVSVTLTPVMAYYLLPGMKSLSERESKLVSTLKRWNEAMLRKVLMRQKAVFAVTAVLIVAGVAGMLLLPRVFLPSFNEGTFTVNVSFNPGISLAESNRVGAIAERLLLEIPGVKVVGRRTGRAELDEHAEGIHISEIEVLMEPNASKAEVAAEIRTRLAVLPVSVVVGQPISHRIDHMLSGVRAEIALKIFGDDLDALRRTAEELRGKIASVPGIRDLQVEKQVLIPHLEVRVDYQKAALYGVQPATVVEQISRLSSGRVISRVVDGYRRFDVVLRLPENMRTTQGLGDYLIQTPSGWVPARQIAEIRETDGPNQILRENGRRRIAVFANTDGTGAAEIAAEINRRLSETKLPQGVFATLEGNFEAQASATRKIAGLSLVSLLLIFAVLYSRYRSAVLTLIILGSIPFALVGSVAALWITGLPLSVASMIGFVTLTGIATRNGILKVSHYINLSLREGMPFGEALIVRGALERMTPVLMTALSAGVALLPLMIDASSPGKEILHPVAVTIFGGLVSATLLDAILTPLLFLRFGRAPLERLREEFKSSAAGKPSEAF
jgi:HME family heavy-metal exporter